MRPNQSVWLRREFICSEWILHQSKWTNDYHELLALLKVIKVAIHFFPPSFWKQPDERVCVRICVCELVIPGLAQWAHVFMFCSYNTHNMFVPYAPFCNYIIRVCIMWESFLHRPFYVMVRTGGGWWLELSSWPDSPRQSRCLQCKQTSLSSEKKKKKGKKYQLMLKVKRLNRKWKHGQAVIQSHELCQRINRDVNRQWCQKADSTSGTSCEQKSVCTTGGK